jgi:hypothetical protein
LGTWLKPVYIAEDGFGSLKTSNYVGLVYLFCAPLPSLVKHNVINFSYNLVFKIREYMALNNDLAVLIIVLYLIDFIASTA